MSTLGYVPPPLELRTEEQKHAEHTATTRDYLCKYCVRDRLLELEDSSNGK